MACPKCDHTMHKVGVCLPPYTEVPIFWCPRCGTLKANIVTGEDESPTLVDRVERFADQFGEDDDTIIPVMRRMGILESIGKIQQEH